MKQFYFIFFCGLLCTATMSAQTWNCGYPNEEDVTATLSNGTMTVRGTGDMADLWDSPWDAVKEQILKVVIEEGVTSIGEAAFFTCTDLSELTIGNTVGTIGNAAFDGCNISFVNIPDGVEFIGAKSFAQGAITHLVIPASVKEIGAYAFAYNNELEEISVSWSSPTEVTVETYGTDDCFYGIGKASVLLHVPFGTKAAYEADAVWNGFTIVDYAANLHLAALTVSTGRLSPAFLPTQLNYTVIVPHPVENITLTATPVDAAATVTGAGQKALHTGDNTFEITVTATEGSLVYTIIITRTTNDYSLEAISSNEITTGATTTTYFDPVTNSNKTVPVIDKYEMDYALTTGNFSGNLTLLFDFENGRYTYEKDFSVEAHSIYEFTLSWKPGSYGVFTFTTYYDAFGRPSYTTMSYSRHSCDVAVSENSELVSIESLNIVGSSISNISASNLKWMGEVPTHTVTFDTQGGSAIYPNPFTDVVYITGAEVETGRATSLQVINIAGAIVHTQIISSSNETIRLGHLPAGLYFFRLEKEGRTKMVKGMKIR